MLSRLSLCIAVVGCAATATEPEITAEPRILCPEDMCGGNSPTIAAYGFYNFNIDGRTTNGVGFRLMGMSQKSDWYDLVVSDSHIIGRSPYGDISGSALIGATIWIAQGRRQYGIVI